MHIFLLPYNQKKCYSLNWSKKLLKRFNCIYISVAHVHIVKYICKMLILEILLFSKGYLLNKDMKLIKLMYFVQSSQISFTIWLKDMYNTSFQSSWAIFQTSIRKIIAQRVTVFFGLKSKQFVNFSCSDLNFFILFWKFFFGISI